MAGEKLTKKQTGFVKDYVDTGNATQAVLNNYDIKDNATARSIGSENLTKPSIVNAINSIAEQIPDSLLVEKHLELLNAQKITTTKVRGEITDVEESVDNQAISKGLDMAYKIKGIYAPDKSINVNINGEQTEEHRINGELFNEWLKIQTA